MNEVRFFYNGLERSVSGEDIKTEEQLHHKLCQVFDLIENVEFTGIRHAESDRLYSLQEIVNCPSIFQNSIGIVIIGRNIFNCIIIVSSLSKIAKENNFDDRNSLFL